ncbi:choice-of-anchor D domain-containing protein [Nodosilinea sp. P-1105]|uniref:choice-of-anchor D domain-containing protein n=1 Tax=Nodosilinea sp. P-1105 TaxID=2546229 RepID=UPI00146B8A22|nr:choice-of-anchor D domain-containing protein [Nodosilinea sp. P-1105]NMF84560.1 choice-of-anchor D domain-containing protein [Nodosilinea sp. P-1105]
MAPSVSAPDAHCWHLAQAGDADAIARLINHSLRGQAVRATATVEGRCLDITLRSPYGLHPDKVFAWLQAGLSKLSLPGVQRLSVTAWTGEVVAPTWQRTVDLPTEPGVGHQTRVDLTPSPDATSVTIQARDIIGQVVVGNNNTVIGPGGNLVVYPLSPNQRPRVRPVAVGDRFCPPPFPHLLDRVEETQQIATACQRGQTVDCFSAPGFGKTALLRATAHRPEITAQCPEGVIYLRAGRHTAADLAQALFEAFYTADVPFKPTDIQIRRALKGKKALVLIDDLAIEREEVQGLLLSFPDLTFLLASQRRSLWGEEAAAIPLPGLPLRDAIALIDHTLGNRLQGSELQAAEALCRHLQGHPLRILQAVSQAQHQRLGMVTLAQQVMAAPSPEQAILATLNQLPNSDQRAIAVLALLGGTPLDIGALAHVTGNPTVATLIETLQAWHWVLGDGLGYRLAENLVQPLQPLFPLGDWLPRLATGLTTWMQQHSPALIADHGDAIVQVMELAAQAGQWTEVLRLGQALDGALIVEAQWGLWEQALQVSLQAARAVGDQAAEAWVLHQRGSRCLSLGDTIGAYPDLLQALAIREALQDTAAATLTRHNLSLFSHLLNQDADPPLELLPPTVTTPDLQHRWPLGRWLAIAAPLLLAVVTTWLVWPRPNPPGDPVPEEPSGDPLRPEEDQPLTPDMRVDRATINFEPQEIGTTSAPQTLTITNPGEAPLPLNPQAWLTGRHPEDFVITQVCTSGDGALPATLAIAPGETCTVQLVFQPQQAGDRTATLTLSSDALDQSLQIPLAGTGTTIPRLSISPSTLTFESQVAGSQSDAQTLTVTNHGTGALTLDAVTLTADQAAAFRLDPQTCAEQTLEPQASCTIQVAFSPGRTSPSQTVQAQLQVQSNAPDAPHTIPLTGEVVANDPDPLPEARLQVSPTQLAFGAQPVNGDGQSAPLVLANPGRAPLQVEALRIGGPQASDFSLQRRCSVVEPGGECQLSVQFRPTAPGDRQATLTLTSNAVNTPTVTIGLQGRGVVPEVTVSPSTINFGYQTQTVESIVITSRGEAPLRIEGISLAGNNPDYFEITANRCAGLTLATAGSTCTIDLRYHGDSRSPNPTQADSLPNAQLLIRSNATTTPDTVALSGQRLI